MTYMALRAAVWIEATPRATAAFAPLAVGRRPLRTAAQGRFDPFGVPFGNGRYLRLPTVYRARPESRLRAGTARTRVASRRTGVPPKPPFHSEHEIALTAQKRSLPGDEAVYIYSHAASIREDID